MIECNALWFKISNLIYNVIEQHLAFGNYAFSASCDIKVKLVKLIITNWGNNN